MAFDHTGILDNYADVWCDRWSSLSEAEAGHAWLRQRLGGVRFTLGLWWDLIWKAVREEEE